MSDRIPVGESGQSYKGLIMGRDENGYVRKVYVDEIGRTVGIDTLHDLIHNGEMFFISVVFRDVPDGSTVYIQHITGEGKNLHTQISADSVGKWLFQSFSNATITDNGTLLTPIPRKVPTDVVVTTEFYSNPTLSNQGTARLSKLFGSGTQPSRFTSGDFSERLESVFGENVEVLVGFTNESGSPQDLTITLDFYETPFF